MPDLAIQVVGAEPVAYGVTPLLHFRLQVTNQPPTETIQAVLLHTQIQIESPRRTYNDREKEKLSDLFGAPERWSQTLRNRLWTHANVMIRSFTGNTDCILPVPCTYDLNLTATKYFYALEEGDVCLLFLFSGTVFYLGADERLQTQPISWDRECAYRLPLRLWREMMEMHYPNSAWLYLHKDSFERLYAYKRRNGLATWEQTIERLLPVTEQKECARMKAHRLEQIIKAVLYEGYILYPYRASAKKNRERFTFGRVYPQAYNLAQNGAEPCVMQTECLARARTETPSVEVSVRFLHPIMRTVGSISTRAGELTEVMAQSFQAVPELTIDGRLFQTWQEAAEREVKPPPILLDAFLPGRVTFPFRFFASREFEPIRNREQHIAGAILRRQEGLEGEVEILAVPVGQGLFKITARILNHTPVSEADLGDSQAILLRTFASTHAVLQARGAEFLSLTDPPAECRELAAKCKNTGVWPVFVGDESKGERDTLLASPIILSDYPQIAPESQGDFFDGTEIDEMLTLRIQTMTDEEKREMRHVDEQARRLLERTENISDAEFLKTHGTLRAVRSCEEQIFGTSKPLKGVSVGKTFLQPGDHVRIRPKTRADIMDMALAGKTAAIEAVEQDAEGQIHLALIVQDDPGKDLGKLRQPGHRFFYGLDEIELMEEQP